MSDQDGKSRKKPKHSRHKSPYGRSLKKNDKMEKRQSRRRRRRRQSQEDETTVFEEVNARRRPAISRIRHWTIKWKKPEPSAQQASESTSKAQQAQGNEKVETQMASCSQKVSTTTESSQMQPPKESTKTSSKMHEGHSHQRRVKVADAKMREKSNKPSKKNLKKKKEEKQDGKKSRKDILSDTGHSSLEKNELEKQTAIKARHTKTKQSKRNDNKESHEVVDRTQEEDIEERLHGEDEVVGNVFNEHMPDEGYEADRTKKKVLSKEDTSRSEATAFSGEKIARRIASGENIMCQGLPSGTEIILEGSGKEGGSEFTEEEPERESNMALTAKQTDGKSPSVVSVESSTTEEGEKRKKKFGAAMNSTSPPIESNQTSSPSEVSGEGSPLSPTTTSEKSIGTSTLPTALLAPAGKSTTEKQDNTVAKSGTTDSDKKVVTSAPVEEKRATAGIPNEPLTATNGTSPAPNSPTAAEVLKTMNAILDVVAPIKNRATGDIPIESTTVSNFPTNKISTATPTSSNTSPAPTSQGSSQDDTKQSVNKTESQ